MSAKKPGTAFRTRCRGTTCGTEVEMQPDGQGRMHPFDWPPKACPRCKGKGHVAGARQSSLFGDAGAPAEVCKKCHGYGVVYTSHFATCPNADEFRRAKG